MNIDLPQARVRSIRADMVKGSVLITLEVGLDRDILRAKPELAALAIQEIPISVHIESDQPRLFDVQVMPLCDEEAAACVS